MSFQRSPWPNLESRRVSHCGKEFISGAVKRQPVILATRQFSKGVRRNDVECDNWDRRSR
jgi:hypothetical protein